MRNLLLIKSHSKFENQDLKIMEASEFVQDHFPVENLKIIDIFIFQIRSLITIESSDLSFNSIYSKKWVIIEAIFP